MQQTYIANAIDIADVKARYDTQVKYILSDKGILARILKYTVKELADYDIDTIIHSIEGFVQVNQTYVNPGRTNQFQITGLKDEDKVPGEGEVKYDIRFHLLLQDKEWIKILINVEAQKKFYPGYDLVTRGIFYCARMISAQKDTEFSGENYDDIKKVYSIWICMDTPKRAANTITEYAIEQHKLYGEFEGNARYDLLSLVVIGLGRENDRHPQSELHRMLDVLLSKRLPEDKKRILEKEFQIPMSQSLEKGLDKMCNLSDLVEEQGIERGIETGIKAFILDNIEEGVPRERIMGKLVKRFQLTDEKAKEYMEQFAK